MVRLIKPYIAYEDVEAELRGVFDSGVLTKGRYSREFPNRIAAYTGAKHAFLTTSATTALWLCLKALGVGKGDEVVVSDFSFPATVNVVEDLGATPVFVDVLPSTFNMDPQQLEEKIGPATKACMFVDALGNPSQLLEVRDICHAHGVVLIEDAACGMGSLAGGERVGNIADLTCFSFHPRKLIACGEGGAITTNNDEYAAFFAQKLNHGADPETGLFSDYGYNFRLPEIPCLMGLRQLERLDQVIEERREQRARYAQLLEPLGFVAQAEDAGVLHNIQSVVFKVPEGVARDELVRYLADNDIESTIGTYSLSSCEYYRGKYNDVQPIGALLEATTITLPCYEGVPVEEVADACRSYMDSRQ